jgi:GH43 family beta-xylosidase
MCANDDYIWERVGEKPENRGLHEAPQVLQRGGRTFVVYSCSSSWQITYKLALLELRPGGDPLNPANWKNILNRSSNPQKPRLAWDTTAL